MILYDKENNTILRNYNEIYFDHHTAKDIYRVSLDLYIVLI
jgi:hypothetical protein